MHFLSLTLITFITLTADMLKEEKTGGKKFMDFGGEILPYAAANNIKVGLRGGEGVAQGGSTA